MPAVRNSGFSLVEIMVSLVVVAIALLGFATLQMESMKNTERAKSSQTVNSAMLDLAERISNMPEQAKDGSFNFDNLTTGTAPVAIKDCLTDTCSAAELASAEISNWYTQISQRSPSPPRLSITSSSLDDGTLIRISLVWDAGLTGTVGSSCSSTTSSSAVATANQCDHLEIFIP